MLILKGMKKANDKPLTEAVFVSTIQELRGTFGTKGELKATKEELQLDIVDLEFRMNEKFEKYDEKNRGYRDEIVTKVDKVLKELVEMRDENTASTLHFERNDEAIAIHEKRIIAIEHAKN
jgi:hypothetical protein